MLRLDNPSSDTTATATHIDRLFPKCRPRDHNLNAISPLASQRHDDNHNGVLIVMDTETERRMASSRDNVDEGDPEEDEGNGDDNDDTETSSDDMNDDDDNVDHSQDDSSNDVIVVSSGHKGQSYKLREPTEPSSDVIVVSGGKGGTYKLRDSRIIEIAGGREMFSHSRTKGSRKSRFNDEPDKVAAKRNKMQGVWEMRSRNGEQKKQRNARDVTETVFSTEVHSVRHPRSANSPGGAVQLEVTPTETPRDAQSPLSVSKGEVVVFDDIDDDWRGLRLDGLLGADNGGGGGGGKEEEPDSTDESLPSPPTHHRNASDFFKAVTSGDLDGNSLSPEHVAKVGRVIGGLPIADYEGSPRRYGPRAPDSSTHPTLPSAQSLLASPSVYPPRPGFPQRVLPTSTDCEPPALSPTLAGGTFDYLYEFSETRKVLEEFFKCPSLAEEGSAEFQELEYDLRRQAGSSYVGQRLAKAAAEEGEPRKDGLFLDLSADETGSNEGTEIGLQVGHSRNFTLSPETTDCDSNCGDLDSEASLLMEGDRDGAGSGGEVVQDSLRIYSSMPVLEDGLSSGHASDTDNNNPTMLLMRRQISEIEREIVQRNGRKMSPDKQADAVDEMFSVIKSINNSYNDTNDLELEALDPLAAGMTPPPPAPAPHRGGGGGLDSLGLSDSVEAAIKDIRLALQRTKPLKSPASDSPDHAASPVWVPRRRGDKEDGDEEADTDLETDRLLGQQRIDDHGFFDDKGWRKPKSRTVMPSAAASKTSTPLATTKLPTSAPKLPPVATPNSPPVDAATAVPGTSDAVVVEDENGDKALSPAKDTALKAKKDKDGSTKKKGRNKEVMIHEPAVLIEGVLFRAHYLGSTQLVCEGQPTKSTRMMQAEEAVSRIKDASVAGFNQSQHVAGCRGPVLFEGLGLLDDGPVRPTVFRLSFVGSVQVDEEAGRKRRKRLKKLMVEEAVAKIKAPEGETQPSTEVDLFISTEKIMVLNTDLKEIMMDHALRTISYIADIGDLVVLMARRRFVPHDLEEPPKVNRTPKMICHVFESEEAQFIAQSIGQAFQVAYMEFLKANGIEDHSFVKEMDYQEVLNSQEIFGDELQMFAKKEMQKEVVVPKAKNEILGVVIVESGWGSMLPTVVIANLAPAGAAARCGQLNIGDQIIAINGVSLVGLPLSTCQNYIKNTKNQTVVKLTVVPCAPVVEVKIKRPDTKYQLGFSVQNGVICSLLRGGIAERGGVRVGHRIIEINNQSVVAVPHEKIVNLLATSVGEILMKTMPTSMFRLLTGQETPLYI